MLDILFIGTLATNLIGSTALLLVVTGCE